MSVGTGFGPPAGWCDRGAIHLCQFRPGSECAWGLQRRSSAGPVPIPRPRNRGARPARLARPASRRFAAGRRRAVARWRWTIRSGHTGRTRDCGPGEARAPRSSRGCEGCPVRSRRCSVAARARAIGEGGFIMMAPWGTELIMIKAARTPRGKSGLLQSVGEATKSVVFFRLVAKSGE